MRAYNKIKVLSLLLVLLQILLSCKQEDDGPGTITFVDKKGVPFTGLHFYLESSFHVSQTTDQSGVYKTEKAGTLKPGLAYEYWWYPAQSIGNDFVGWLPYTQPKTLESLGKGNYKVTLSRILFFDGAGDTEAIRRTGGFFCTTGASNCVSSNTKYIAQAFVAPQNMEVCFIGLGQHGGLSPQPTTIGIHLNGSGKPGSLISVDTPIVSSDGILTTSLAAGATADLCSSGSPPITLSSGTTYWIVGSYASTIGSNPYLFNYMGSTLSPASGLPLIESADGITWTNMPTLKPGIKSLFIFVAQ